MRDTDSGRPADGDIASDVPVAPGTVTIRVTAVAEASAVDATMAAPGSLYSVISVVVSNGLSDAIDILPPVFSLRLDSGLEIIANPLSVRLDAGCPANARLAAGRSVSCNLAFEISASSTEETLILTLPGVGTYETTTPARSSCERCGGDSCVDLMTDRDNCGTCGTSVGGQCVDGALTCDGEEYLDSGENCLRCRPDSTCDGRHSILQSPDSRSIYNVVGPAVSCGEVCAILGLGCFPTSHSGFDFPNCDLGDDFSCEEVIEGCDYLACPCQ